LFFGWLYGLRDRIAVDELGPDGWFPDTALERVLQAGGGAWADDVRTPEVETLERLEEEAVRAASAVAAERVWGEVHRERSAHVLGDVGWLDRLLGLHVGPYPGPGGPHTVRADDPARWSALDSSAWTFAGYGEYGPSERFVAQLVPGRPTGWFLLPTGQSGNPVSPHYRDMQPRWADGAPIQVPLEREATEARAVARMHLDPPP
ncbi:MAG: penicillin acylase family protein, partial [Gemmatimonadota bacterium]